VKEDLRQLVVPIKKGVDPATFLVGLLRELIPPATPEPVVTQPAVTQPAGVAAR